MKVVLYMTITSNGFIAHEDGTVDYALKGAWKSYTNFFKKTGNMIIGKNTYDIMPKDEFIPECLYLVLTKNPPKEKKGKNIVFTDKSPKEIISMLKKKGFKTIGVGGGGQINSLFLREGLLDEIIFDVEPVILSKGLPIFPSIVADCHLELLSTKKLSKNEIQLCYKVK